MDLKDIDLKDGRLHQDEWSSEAVLFGKENQLRVVGWDGYSREGGKLYIVKCSICSLDSLMFGEGYFRTRKLHVKRNILPCGCAPVSRWSQKQWAIRIDRRLSEIGASVVAFHEDTLKAGTTVTLRCEKHGEWETKLNCLLNIKSRCHACSEEITATKNTKTDEEMISSFLKSGSFLENTRFWRSDRVNTQGAKVYWFSHCPECDTINESISGSLQRGHLPCMCSTQKQTEAYINIVEQFGGAIAIKFGIASNSLRRAKQQDSKASTVSIINCMVYAFPDKDSCRSAERLCKELFACSYLRKEVVPDGYTETTCLFNINKVAEVYESFGGILKR